MKGGQYNTASNEALSLSDVGIGIGDRLIQRVWQTHVLQIFRRDDALLPVNGLDFLV